MTLVSLFLVLAALNIFQTNSAEVSTYIFRLIVLIVGLIGFLFFGYTTLIVFILIITFRPALKIDKKGLTDRSTGMSTGFISYNQIKVVSNRQPYIVVHLKDPEVFLSKAPFYKRKYRELNKKLGYDYIMIELTMYDNQEINSIAKEINQRIRNTREDIEY
ncbi:hypothetical protein TEHD86_0553 [Tetragenococcus halophilus subsp. halophilus]|nr:hypothetical protein TEHD10_1384 [Tetragenococcus halophilus subsp. halophilus]GBD81831.1 hypothetical protein TEHD86_0553 [Tetragenococcus halophilus subsp. halophilus]GLL51312.1 hypothetical protein YA5_012880 [Tetragenococcus halophilus]